MLPSRSSVPFFDRRVCVLAWIGHLGEGRYPFLEMWAENTLDLLRKCHLGLVKL